MSISAGPKSETTGLIFSVDSKNRRSNLHKLRDSNILTDPFSTWTLGSGGSSGYSQNGDTAENERILISDDPWGSNSIVWETRASGNGNADGGWNSSYFSIDDDQLYRHSVWVRRTSSSAGGTFYLGTNPAPIRNDNGAAQSNPYWECEGTGNLAQNTWYLVTAHTFPASYTGGRHPDSGMWTRADGYTPGSPTRQVNGCNVGNSDVRWNPGTTSVQHRTYHYYCGDSTTRLQFAYPRVDKCDGTEPSIAELLYTPPSVWENIVNSNTGSKQTGNPSYTTLGGAECFRFTASNQYFDDQVTLPRVPSQYLTIEAWIYPEAEVTSGDRGTIVRIHDGSSAYFSWNKSTQQLSTYWYGHSPVGYHELGPAMARNQWHHVCAVWDGATHYHYIDGVQYSTSVTGSSATGNYVEIGMESSGRQFAGGIGSIKIYDTALTKDQVLNNFNSQRGRYNI